MCLLPSSPLLPFQSEDVHFWQVDIGLSQESSHFRPVFVTSSVLYFVASLLVGWFDGHLTIFGGLTKVSDTGS